MKHLLALAFTALACAAIAFAAEAPPPAAKLFAVTITTGPAWDAAKPAQD
jgi:hypothetical protein